MSKVHVTHNGSYSGVDIRDYDNAHDPVVKLRIVRDEASIEEARQIAQDILASCDIAESYFTQGK